MNSYCENYEKLQEKSDIHKEAKTMANLFWYGL